MHAHQLSDQPHSISGHCKLRGDLVISRQESRGADAFVLKDPVSGRFFRFREIEFFIARQLDGATPLAVIREAVEREFGSALAPATLEQFTQKLRQLGLLETNRQQSPTPARRQRRTAGNAFYFRFKVFDPDRLLDRLVRRLWFCFTPGFLTCSAALIFVSLGITVLNWGAIGRDFLRLYQFQALVLAWVTVIFVTAAHEFAHGLTCKRFGGEVHDIGFLLVYFQPALYCNVSDAWLFPGKAERLWVTFAGAYCELILWAAATLIWRVTDPGNSLNYVALVVVATSAIKTFFNLNPLIKLDGYYLLSDYLEVPNLRQKAFGYLGNRVKALFGSTILQRAVATARERRIYVVYGLVAAAYSLWLSGYVALLFGRFLVYRYQGWGFLIFTTLLAGIFHRPLGNGLAKVTSAVRLARGPVGVPISGAKMVSQDARDDTQQTGGKRGKHWRRTLAKVVLGCAAAALLFLVRTDLTISGEFTIRPEHNTDLRAEVEGIIEEIYVAQGDMVGKGDLIARLTDWDYRAQLREVNAHIQEAQAELNLLKAGPRKEEVERARAGFEKAQERFKYAAQQLDRMRLLFAQRVVSRQHLEEAEEEVAVRDKESKEAEDELRLLLAGSRPEEIEAGEAKVAGLQAQRARLEDYLKRVRIVSPVAGVVTTPKLKEKVGQRVKKGALIAKVHQLKTVTAEIAVPEKEIADVRVGQTVVLKARAYPSERFRGVVTSIAPIVTEEDKPDEVWGKTVLVTTELDNSSRLLKSEMTGYAKIYSSKRRIIELVTRRLTRYLRVEFWSWW